VKLNRETDRVGFKCVEALSRIITVGWVAGRAVKTEWWGAAVWSTVHRRLYDLHINSMTYTLFFTPDYQFQKVFLYFLIGNNLLLFCGGPLVVEAPGQLPSLPPPLYLALVKLVELRTMCIRFACLQCFDPVGWAAGRASGL